MRADESALRSHIAEAWTGDVLDELQGYLRIPNVSVAFDADWRASGYMDAAVERVRAWCASCAIERATVEVVEIEGASPLVLVEIPAFGSAEEDAPAALLYGHLDKQPEMVGWRDGLGPWTPVVEGDRLYGRGGADDGYAVFASLTALAALEAAGGSHRRVVVLIESEEESGSPHLGDYVAHLADRLGEIDLVVCLDSGCLDWDRLWLTTSLRGLVGMDVTVEVLREGVHSGDASGVVPSSMRVLRQLFDRLEDAATGRVLVPELHGAIPNGRVGEAAVTAAIVGQPIAAHFPFVEGVEPMTDEPVEQILARTWRPTLSYVGADGLPPTTKAGNVLRPSTTFKLSFRVPPGVDTRRACDAVVAVLTTDPPSGARITVHDVEAADGWDAPVLSPWLAAAVADASRTAFGAEAASLGEGGSIPFMGMLGRRFPQAQFLVTGVLGPGTNAHGPNEFLHLPTAARLTEVVALVLDAHAGATRSPGG